MKYILKGRIKTTKGYGNFLALYQIFHHKRLETVFPDSYGIYLFLFFDGYVYPEKYGADSMMPFQPGFVSGIIEKN